MSRIAIGFILGAIVTGVAFVTFPRSPAEVETTRSATTDGPDATSSAPAISDEVPTQETSPNELVVPNTFPINNYESDEARLIAQLADARELVAETSRELRELQFANGLAEIRRQPLLNPLPLPDEFDWALNDNTAQLLHETIQREPRDRIWAESTEAELQQFIYGQSEVTSKLGAPTINCGSTRCEVTLVNYAAGEDSLAVGMRLRSSFQRELANEGEIANQFWLEPGSFWIGEHYEDGVATVYWSLPRRTASAEEVE